MRQGIRDKYSIQKRPDPTAELAALEAANSAGRVFFFVALLWSPLIMLSSLSDGFDGSNWKVSKEWNYITFGESSLLSKIKLNYLSCKDEIAFLD